mgnify:CR=1 FL=1
MEGGRTFHFVDASLQQLIAAARLPFDGISETAVNASLAFIEGAKPQDEVECALVIQMACTHAAAMAVLASLGSIFFLLARRPDPPAAAQRRVPVPSAAATASTS